MKSTNQNLHIVLAQLNPLVGDIENNLIKIKNAATYAKNVLHANVVVFPEMVLAGYPPEDLLLRPEFYERINRAIDDLKRFLPDTYLIVGYPERNHTGNYNSAGVFYAGKIIAHYHKQLLPNYGVFDEKRYFQSGKEPCIIGILGNKIAILICEDLWQKEPIQQAKINGAEIVISINASPFDLYKPLLREEIMAERAKETHLPIIYLNTVGAQDELVFDGGSFVMNSAGEITQRGVFFEESLIPVDLIRENGVLQPKTLKALPIIDKIERVYKALVLGIRDYIEKNHFPGALIGLSGGIDSALTLALAVDAIGKDRVKTVFMPSRYTRQISSEGAEAIAKNFGVAYNEISIEPVFQSFLQSLSGEFSGTSNNTAEENLQARCRGTILMAISNKKHYIVLSTGNKSEMSVGYATLYGDMVGGFCVLKDVPKTLVYELVNYRNSLDEIPLIPQRIIDRPPSAELATDQKDTDSLPPYPILDAILERFVENDQSAEEIIAAGFDATIVKKVINMVYRNEYKRSQAPVGVRITARAFGRDRRYPITSGF